jgi:hypothetical protein
MNQLVHIIKRWHILLECHRALSRWFPVAILALVLGIGFTPSLRVVQAQDAGTGQRLQSYFALEVIPPTTPFCLGSTKPVQVTVRQIVADSAVHVKGITIQYSYSESILQDLSASPSSTDGSVLREQPLSFKGQATGSGSIDITAIVPTITLIGDGKELALPIQNRPITLQTSVPIEVIACDYDLTVGMSWVTQTGKAQAILSYGLPSARIRFNRETNGMLDGLFIFNFSSSANRILGCRGVSTHHFSAPQNLTGQRLEDGYIRLELEIYPQAADVLFSCDQSTEGRPRSCEDLPDGRCSSDINPRDIWRVETVTVELPTAGGMSSFPVRITHARGEAIGLATFTLTPVTQ